jgi:hypothetical protein
MKITTKAVFDIESGELLAWEGFDYEGPIEHCGGGPSGNQQAAQQQTLQNAQQEGQLAGQSAQQFNALGSSVSPFYQNEMTNGLPYYGNLTDSASGSTAQAYAPAKASYLRGESSMGPLPSGSKAAGLNDINEAQAQTFSNQLIGNQAAQQQAKQQGAAGTAGMMQAYNPAAFYGGSSGAGSAGMSPLQPQYNPWMGIAGGAVQGAASAAPFAF